MNFFGVAVDGANSLGHQTLDLGDVRCRVALLLPRPPSEKLEELFTCKDSKNNADADLRLGIRSKVLS